MAAFDFPNSPNTNDTYTDNGMTFIWNGSVWKKDASAGVKGEKGQKGEKGEKGQKGQNGNDATGTKGQKGEVGQKGQKGEDNSTKGQKGDDNSTKGQKGEAGADNSTKGQKGEQGTPAIQNENTSTYRNLVFIDSSGATVIKTNDNNRLQVRSSDGALRVAGDITAFYSSDENLKENITPIPNALDKIIAISGNTFTWKSGDGDDTGVIAQEIEALGLPGITTVRDDGVKAVRYEKLVPLLIQAIKELDDKVNSLS